MNKIPSKKPSRNLRRVIIGLTAIVAAILFAGVIFYLVMFLGSRDSDDDFEALGATFYASLAIGVVCGVAGGFSIFQAIRKNGWCRRVFKCFLVFFFHLFFWAFFWVGFMFLLEEWDLNPMVGLLWLNIPIGITAYQSYRRTSREWDWCFITLLVLYADIVACLLINGAWLPDTYFLRGLLFGFVFVVLVLAVAFIHRLVKRKVSTWLFVYYLLGLITIGAVYVGTQIQWSMWQGR